MKERICSKCGECKPLDKYHISKRHPLGRKMECAECTNAYLRKHYHDNRKGTKEQKMKATSYHYLRRYGISYLEYKTMCQQRDFKCDICGKVQVIAGEQPRGSKKHLVLDHCHTSGIIRGVLCQECNQGIGLMKEDKTILLNAIEYLERNNQ